MLSDPCALNNSFMEFRTFTNTVSKLCNKIKHNNSAVLKILLTELVQAREEIFRDMS